MGTTVLVEELINQGEIFILYLLENKWKIDAAFWNQDKESLEWKLYLSIPLKREGARSIYLKLTKRISTIEKSISINVYDIKLVNPKSEIVNTVKCAVNQDENSQGIIKSLFITDNNKIYGQTICYKIKKMKKLRAKHSGNNVYV